MADRQPSPFFLPGKSRVTAGKVHRAPAGAGKLKTFGVYRWAPDERRDPRVDIFEIDLDDCGPTVLDALIEIKRRIDPTLAFRRSCGQGLCGSCAMNIDGANTLACTAFIQKNDDRVTVYPLSHADVVKDLVPDLDLFYAQYALIEPWSRTEAWPGRAERLQSPAALAGLDGLWQCNLCGCCTMSCPVYWRDGETYLGPAVLQQAYRWVSDSREARRGDHLRALEADPDRLFACRAFGICTLTCPRGLDPAGAIAELKKLTFPRG